MLSIEECKKYIADESIPDETVEEMRDALYALVEGVFDAFEQKSTSLGLDLIHRISDDVPR